MYITAIDLLCPHSTPFWGVPMYGVVLVQSEAIVCIYDECNSCENRRCVKKALFILRKFQLKPLGIDKTHSVAFRFTEAFDALRALEALKYAKIKAKIIYPI